MATYGQYVVRVQPFEVGPVTTEELTWAMRRAPCNAGGLDSWLPAELRHAPSPPTAIARLRDMFLLVEEGARGQNSCARP
eukprot:5968877-Alexandrium_andersonii.AAC.1